MSYKATLWALPLAACVQHQEGTTVRIGLSSQGSATPLVDTAGRAWTIEEAAWAVEEAWLTPCEAPSAVARIAPWQGDEPDGLAPLPSPDPLQPPEPIPRHAGDPLGAVEGAPVVADLRTFGTFGGWRLSPPVAAWCGVALALTGTAEHPAWSVVATGPHTVDAYAGEDRILDLSLPEPLHLTAEHPDASLQIVLDLSRWLGAVEPPVDPSQALPQAVRVSQVSW